MSKNAEASPRGASFKRKGASRTQRRRQVEYQQRYKAKNREVVLEKDRVAARKRALRRAGLLEPPKTKRRRHQPQLLAQNNRTQQHAQAEEEDGLAAAGQALMQLAAAAATVQAPDVGLAGVSQHAVLSDRRPRAGDHSAYLAHALRHALQGIHPAAVSVSAEDSLGKMREMELTVLRDSATPACQRCSFHCPFLVVQQQGSRASGTWCTRCAEPGPGLVVRRIVPDSQLDSIEALLAAYQPSAADQALGLAAVCSEVPKTYDLSPGDCLLGQTHLSVLDLVHKVLGQLQLPALEELAGRYEGPKAGQQGGEVGASTSSAGQQGPGQSGKAARKHNTQVSLVARILTRLLEGWCSRGSPFPTDGSQLQQYIQHIGSGDWRPLGAKDAPSSVRSPQHASMLFITLVPELAVTDWHADSSDADSKGFLLTGVEDLVKAWQTGAKEFSSWVKHVMETGAPAPTSHATKASTVQKASARHQRTAPSSTSTPAEAPDQAVAEWLCIRLDALPTASQLLFKWLSPAEELSDAISTRLLSADKEGQLRGRGFLLCNAWLHASLTTQGVAPKLRASAATPVAGVAHASAAGAQAGAGPSGPSQTRSRRSGAASGPSQAGPEGRRQQGRGSSLQVPTVQETTAAGAGVPSSAGGPHIGRWEEAHSAWEKTGVLMRRLAEELNGPAAGRLLQESSQLGQGQRPKRHRKVSSRLRWGDDMVSGEAGVNRSSGGSVEGTATPRAILLKQMPGQGVSVPVGWVHIVRNLRPCLKLSRDIVHPAKLHQYVEVTQGVLQQHVPLANDFANVLGLLLEVGSRAGDHLL